MTEKQLTTENIIMNRMASEIGTLKGQLIQAHVYNEVLINKIKAYEANEAQREAESETSETPASE